MTDHVKKCSVPTTHSGLTAAVEPAETSTEMSASIPASAMPPEPTQPVPLTKKLCTTSIRDYTDRSFTKFEQQIIVESRECLSEEHLFQELYIRQNLKML